MAQTTALVPAALSTPMHNNAENHLASGESSGRLWRVGQTVWVDIFESETGPWYGPKGRLITCGQVGTLLDIYI